jgi:hypothetical protein
MSAPLSHNEQVIERRITDLAALDPGNAQGWRNLIAILKANGQWTAVNELKVLNCIVGVLNAVEDLVAEEGKVSPM